MPWWTGLHHVQTRLIIRKNFVAALAVVLVAPAQTWAKDNAWQDCGAARAASPASLTATHSGIKEAKSACSTPACSGSPMMDMTVSAATSPGSGFGKAKSDLP